MFLECDAMRDALASLPCSTHHIAPDATLVWADSILCQLHFLNSYEVPVA